MARTRIVGVLALLGLAITATSLAYPATQNSATAARSEQVQRREAWYLDFPRTQIQRRETWYLDFAGSQGQPQRREQWYLDFPRTRSGE